MLLGALPLVGLVGVGELALVTVEAGVTELFATGLSLASGLDGVGEVGEAGIELLFCFFESPFMCGTASFVDKAESLAAVEEGEDWLVVGDTLSTGAVVLPAATQKHIALNTQDEPGDSYKAK